MKIKQQESQYQEIDNKRQFIRYLILGALGSILAIKVYLLLFVFDFVVGVYSFVTSFVLFNMLLFSYTKFKDPYNFVTQQKLQRDASPLVSIIVPVKNEEDHISDCINSCVNSTYRNKEIIVVNDGSTDGTAKVLDQIYNKGSCPELRVIHLPKNVGKKKAIKAASSIAKGEFYVFIDSDCEMANDAVEKFVEIFCSDSNIGAITAHGRVRNAINGNVLEKIQDVWYDGQYRIIKGMESSFSSITCCAGALSAYKKIAIQPYLHQWAQDKFLGREFRFATDRLLTAYVLGGKPPKKERVQSSTTAASNHHPMLQTGNDEFQEMKMSFGPDRDVAKESKYYWKINYSPSIRVSIGPPTTFAAFIRQQIRWRKSFIRSIFATGLIYWKRPFPAALLYYMQIGLKIFRPFIVLKALILLPLTGDYVTGALFVTAVLFTGMIYGVDFRLRNPGSTLWVYRPLMTLLSTFILCWLILYSAVTIRKMSWR